VTNSKDGAGLIQLLYKPEQAAVILALGRTKIYELMASGELRSVKCGGPRRIPAAALLAYAVRLDDEAVAA